MSDPKSRPQGDPGPTTSAAGDGPGRESGGDPSRDPSGDPERDERTGRAAAYQRINNQAQWVDLQVRRAMERGDFEDLPGAGKPIQGLEGTHDPDWWVKQLIEREQVTGVAPPAIALRVEDQRLAEQLDREPTEAAVRHAVEDFNARVVEARRQLDGGPPVVTPTRDVDAEVAAWHERRRARREQHRQREREAAEQSGRSGRSPRRRRWWSRGR